ncbi:exodeoxyribonuclease VII large subunit [Piscinibacter terrae]|uniref:exodeoxyribonuclease VII large subunit n=1 Tax=Piscinibacter terrae TaxID=2496871 RepID=UPI001F417DB1|nr:exodeoxyribonuclease VII large subunit [Albitalea terrae]
MIEPAALVPQRLVWSVASLVHAVADTLSAKFSACVVRGELSGFSRAASGHCYFSLKDADGEAALIRCAMFRRAAGLLDFAPGDGQLVEVRGRIAVYEPRGDLQFVVESMQRAGAGALFEQFLRLKARLEAEGLFAPERKRMLPRFPRRIGVVTSLGAAALHDVMTSFARRAPHVEIVVYPSLVQGAEAPEALVAAIAAANAHAVVDVLIVCRGGGSMEDLWSFNDERLVRAIVSSTIPVISGVGHETDVTLADFAADVRAPTPTAAAELVVLALQECMSALDGFAQRMQRRVAHVLDSHAQRLDASALRLARPTRTLQRQSHTLDLLEQRLRNAVHRSVETRQVGLQRLGARLPPAIRFMQSRQGMRVDTLQARLSGLDPRRVLARGYAWLADSQGAPVQSVAQLQPGQSLQAVLADGSAQVAVERIDANPLE